MTNGSAIGYAIIAMQNAGFSDEDVEMVVKQMHYTMDEVDEETAEKKYDKEVVTYG